MRALLLLFVTIPLMLGLLPLLPSGALAADDPPSPDALFREKGLLIGYGRGSIPEGGYGPVFLVGHLGMDLARLFPSLGRHRGLLTFILEPQVNPVTGPETDIEMGLGIGFKYRYPLSDRISIFANASTGPHYISVDTAKQAEGFCFANTVGGGLHYHLSKDTALSFGYRLRHLSNARTRAPNGGIDTHNVLMGISFFY